MQTQLGVLSAKPHKEVILELSREQLLKRSEMNRKKVKKGRIIRFAIG